MATPLLAKAQPEGDWRPPHPAIQVAFLCAAWCRLCGQYKAVVDRVAADFSAQGVTLHWQWIDIEEESDLVGELDVETFPTLVVVDPSAVRFAGAITPHAQTLANLLRATVIAAEPGETWPSVGADVQTFAARLRARAAR
ncbi:MAG TPA: thioredoxin family protein [Rubrivivax sp.]|nr:thioredoxin family protein [Rubrivivax sp.]